MKKIIGQLIFIIFTATAHARETDSAALYRSYDDGATQIVSPSVDFSTQLYDDRLAVSLGYAEDNVTSASSDIVTFGTRDVNGEVVPIIDNRKEFHLTGSWSTGSGGTFGAGYIQSDEDDYSSKLLSLNATREFFTKNTTLSVGFLHGNDTITSAADARFKETMDNQTFNFGLTQIIDKKTIVQFILDARIESGFLASPYRRARLQVGDAVVGQPENHPSTKNRVSAAVRYNYYLEGFKAATSTVYRFYTDSWGVVSHTVEERISKNFSDKLDITFNLRYYMQSKAEFYEDVYTELGTFFTGNNTLGTLNSIVIGVRPTFKVSDKLSVFGKYEQYSIDYKDHTALGDASIASDDEPLKIAATITGLGFIYKF